MTGKDIWVLSEKPSLQAELVAGARMLAASTGGQVAVVLPGMAGGEQQAFSNGADVLYTIDGDAGWMFEDYTNSLVAAIKSMQPHGILIGATKRGKAVAGRLAAALGVSVMADVKKFLPEPDGLKVSHMVFGGGAVRLEKPAGACLVATVGLGIFEAPAPQEGRSGTTAKLEFVKPGWQLKRREQKVKPPSSVNLAAAKKVVCPGRGVQKQEDLEMIFELAKLLEAEVGATRPLTEGLDWLPRERYIGVSGAFIKPDLYLGIGVSGQVQHTVGIGESRVVVAINKDNEAPIFPQADYGIVGDLYAVVPELIKALKARK